MFNAVGVFHSILYCGYQWIREKLHLEVSITLTLRLGRIDLYHLKPLTTLYFLIYDWTPMSECFYCRYSIILCKNYKTLLYIWYSRAIRSLSKLLMHGVTYTFQYFFSYVLKNAASAVWEGGMILGMHQILAYMIYVIMCSTHSNVSSTQSYTSMSDRRG
jgi:hypothetical protein